MGGWGWKRLIRTKRLHIKQSETELGKPAAFLEWEAIFSINMKAFAGSCVAEKKYEMRDAHGGGGGCSSFRHVEDEDICRAEARPGAWRNWPNTGRNVGRVTVEEKGPEAANVSDDSCCL